MSTQLSLPFPSVSFQTETWAQFSSDPEAQGLWLEEAQELAGLGEYSAGLAPDRELYSALAETGMLLILTARRDGRLIGYYMGLVKRHMHSPIVCGFHDLYFLTKTERKGMTGYRLLLAVLQKLKALGCQRVYWSAPAGSTAERLYKRVGMRVVYSTCAMDLET